jgi:hypothetical protein
MGEYCTMPGVVNETGAEEKRQWNRRNHIDNSQDIPDQSGTESARAPSSLITLIPTIIFPNVLPVEPSKTR